MHLCGGVLKAKKGIFKMKKLKENMLKDAVPACLMLQLGDV
jgi:hypothetical protein